MRIILATQGQRRIGKWLAQGKTEGKTEGRADLLLRLLCRRFGGVSTEVEARIRSADEGQIDEWNDRLLDAPTLNDVFGDGPTGSDRTN